MKLGTTTWKVTMADLEAFKTKLTEFVNASEAKRFPTLPKSSFDFEIGRKFARIVVTRYGTNRSCYGFVDMTNGDLLMAAGWKAPAKHARGNIYGENPLSGCGPYGMDYLK